ncbi:MAG: ABC transporter substrate-binding protein [Halobacteriaceae archaeon]
MPSDDDRRRRLTRRRFLRWTGAAGAVGVAGCVGDVASPGGGGEGTEFPDRILRLPIHLGTRPRNGQFNPWGKQSLGFPSLHEQMIDYDPYDDEFVPYLVDWSFEGDTWTLSVKDGVKWHSGDAVTGKDLSVPFRINKVQTPDTGLQKYYDDVTVNEKSIDLHLTDDWAQNMMLFRLHGSRINAGWSVFGQYVEDLENASSDDERSAAISRLNEFSLDEPMGTGMFELDSIRAQRVILTKWPDHIDADHVNFGGVRYRFYPSSQQMWSAVQSGDLDMIYGNQVLLTKSMVANKPDYVDEIRKKRHGGLSLIPQHDDDQLGDLALRKAMAYVINRDTAAKNANAYTQGPAPEPISSISGEVQDEWLGDVMGDFTVYGPGSKPEKATQVLREAGYTKEGGSWMDPNGNPVNVPVHCSADRGTWVAAARTVSGQLDDFGIKSSLSADEPSSYWSTYLDGNFDKTVMGFWGHPAARLPFFQLWLSMLRVVPGQACHFPVEKATVPMPIGDPEGSEQTLDLKALIQEMERIDDEQKMKENVQTVAWAYNQTLPQLPLLQGFHQAAVTRDEWDLPPTDDPAMVGYYLERVRLPNYLLRRDKLKAVESS